MLCAKKFLKNVSVLVSEHRDWKLIQVDLPHTKIISPWLVPLPRTLKFNCDAAVGLSYSSIAVVARDWRGKVVLALSKKVNTTIPLQVEAEAILWATSIAAE